MRLTVLGKSPSWQDAGGACSGYLIEDGDTAVLLDCGNGVFAKLRERMDYIDVDAVVISHLHADHFLDLVPYSYALTYAPRQQPVPVDRWPGTDTPARPVSTPRRAPRHVPPGGGAWGPEDLIENAFDLREYEAGASSRSGRCGCASRGCRTSPRHSRSRISSTGGAGQIVYGADSSPTDALDEFAATPT